MLLFTNVLGHNGLPDDFFLVNGLIGVAIFWRRQIKSLSDGHSKGIRETKLDPMG